MKKNSGKEAVQLESKLTQKQVKFCREYVLSVDSAKAARKAGYSAVNAAASGEKNLQNPKVQEYIAYLRRSESIRTGITFDTVIAELAKIGFSNIADYQTVETETVVTGQDKYGEPITEEIQTVHAKDTADIDREKMAAVAQIKQDKMGNITYQTYDKVAALQKLGEYLGLFKQDVRLTADVNAKVEVKLPPELQQQTQTQIQDADYTVEDTPEPPDGADSSDNS